MPHQIRVTELSSSTGTRARGSEAFATLRPMLDGGTVDLLLDDVDLLSASFLDELVRLLIDGDVSERVTFVTGERATMEKLERVTAIRRADLYARDPTATVRSPVTPRTFKSAPRFSETKGARLNGGA